MKAQPCVRVPFEFTSIARKQFTFELYDNVPGF